MLTFLAVALVLITSTVLVSLALQRRRTAPQASPGAIRNALKFVMGPFPLSVTIHVLIAMFLIITVHESRGRELIMVNLEAGGGGGGGNEEMRDLDMPEVPMPETAPQQMDQPTPVDASQSELASNYVRAIDGGGIGIDRGGGIGPGRGPGFGTGFGGYIGDLRRKGLDVALVIDGTGSMEFVIADVKQRMRALVTAVHRLVPIARVGIVVYGGKGEPIEMQPLTLSPPKLATFLDGIQARDGGEWEENVVGGISAAVDKMDWKPYAKKVIVLVGDSPPEKGDFAPIVEMLQRFRAENGVFNAIDPTELEHQRFEQEFEKRVHGVSAAQQNSESANSQASLPAFYRQTQLAYQILTREGGGEMRSLATNEEINQQVMILAFGSKWRDILAAFASR
jgi:hypothetical protein